MSKTHLQVVVLPFLMLTGCGNTYDYSEVVRFEMGIGLREMVSDELYQELAPQVSDNQSPHMVTIRVPHTLKLKVGSEEIVLRPGGYNSWTDLKAGYRPGGIRTDWNGDYSRFGQIWADTGSRLLTRRDARELAIRLCKTAERGLGVESSIDPASVIDNPVIPQLDHLELLNARISQVCVVENGDELFYMQYSGADDILSENSPRKDEEAFRVSVSLAQSVSRSP